MKELSIEEKAKRYDKALERARDVYTYYCDDREQLRKIESIFPELKESEDEKIRKGIIRNLEYLMDRAEGFVKDELKERIAWLEKQGEQNLTDVRTIGYWHVEDVEQKPADKVEPKFKVGDWVVHDTSDGRKAIRQIVNMTNKSYILDGKDFNTFYFNDLENDYHLWTIADAKDGDMLVNWNNTVFIFKAIEDETVKFHIAYNEKWNAIKTPSTKLSHLGLPEPQFEFRPTTKEQRDILEKTMADAGYTFDFEKKELRKIEQKPTDKEMKELLRTEYEKGRADVIAEMQKPWSEEDELKRTTLIDVVKKQRGSAIFEGLLPEELTDWLESLKERVQPKQEWSEEDEKKRKCLIKGIEDRMGFGWASDPFSREEYINWLKSLKQRYTLKANDEHYELEEFAKIVRGNLTGISKAVQKLFEAKYLQLTGNKMYGGYKD